MIFVLIFGLFGAPLPVCTSRQLQSRGAVDPVGGVSMCKTGEPAQAAGAGGESDELVAMRDRCGQRQCHVHDRTDTLRQPYA